MTHATATASSLAGRITRALAATACALLAAAGPAVAQPSRCEAPLDLDRLVSLLEARTGDARLQEMVTDCGVTFQVDDEAERRLRRAGASRAVIAHVRLAATGTRSQGARPAESAARPSEPATGAGEPAAAPAASSAPATGGPDWLEATRDESSLERKVMAYLKARGMNPYPNDKPDDLRVFLSYTDDDQSPAYDVAVDTLSSSRDGGERVVQINLYSRQLIDPAKLDEVLRVLNVHHQKRWSGVFYIDTDNEVVAQWNVNIPGAGFPVHAELVRDAVQRLGITWLQLYPELKEFVAGKRK